MNMQVRVVWLATAKLENAPVPSPAFNILGQRRLFGQFGVAEGVSLSPQRFEPTVSFHEWATHRLFDGRTSRRGPYEEIQVTESLGLRIDAVDASVFPGDVAVVRVTAVATLSTPGPLEAALARLQDLRSSKELPKVRTLISLVFERLVGGEGGEENPKFYHDYFVMLVELPPSPVDFGSVLSEHTSDIVGLLIGARSPKTLKREVIERTIMTNAELNAKSREELMLINRKGALIVRSGGRYIGPHVSRLTKTRDLATINQFAWVYLNCLQNGLIASSPRSLNVLQAIRRWVEQPELTFFSSVSNTLTWVSLSRSMLLERNLNASIDLAFSP